LLLAPTQAQVYSESILITACTILYVVGLYSDTIKNATFTLTGLSNGVTHIQFTSDGNKILIGFRKVSNTIPSSYHSVYMTVVFVFVQSRYISCWDLRNPTAELASMERVVSTNQRVYFDQTVLVSYHNNVYLYQQCFLYIQMSILLVDSFFLYMYFYILIYTQ